MTTTLEAVPSHLWRIMRRGRSLGWVAVSRNPNGTLEIGWGVRELHRNRGLCTEAATEVLAWLARTYPGEDVMALIRPHNGPSLRVAEKIGMRVAGRDGDLVTVVTGSGRAPTHAPEPNAGMVVVSYERQTPP